jgi:hypothetical protein
VKEFAQRKRRPLYAVEAQPVSSAVFELTPSSVHETFEGWRKALEESDEATALEAERHKYALARRRLLQLCAPVKAQPAVIKSAVPADLTTEDYVQVMLATIREGRRHVNWPQDVVTKFLAAEVIR